MKDDPHREQTIKTWLPADVRPVVATSAGKAIGILSRDRGGVYAGIVLDFDLQMRRAAASDLHLSGQDVAVAIIEHVSRESRILVHSENSSQSGLVVRSLQRAGFAVTQIPMHLLTADSFRAWIEEARMEGSE
jgi:rhodanese-related sulfurtransferase